MNQQQITKIINYFRINHNFHPPYTFIIDGNFLKLLVQKDINLQDKLKPIIIGKYRIKVTSCTLNQLEMLGHDFSIILKTAKQMQLCKCKHSFLPVDKCILQNAKIQQSVIVCSQDKILRRKLRNKNVGIMYFGPDQRITMEDIERHQFKNDRHFERQKFMPTQNQKQELQQYRTQQQTIDKLKKRKQQFKLASARGVELKYIKKKIVKGPNPLSIKKRQHKNDYENKKPHIKYNGNYENSQINNGSQIEKKKRIRKRKNKQNLNPNNNQQ